MTAPASTAQARTLLAQGRHAEALRLTAPYVDLPDAGHTLMALHAQALKLAGRLDESIVYARRAANLWPTSPVAWHNLAAAFAEAGRAEEALAAVEQGMRLGLDAPASWLVQARALRQLRRQDEAAIAYQAALSRDPALTAAATELAQILWMARRDLNASIGVLRAALDAGGEPAALLHAQARLEEIAGDAGAGQILLIDAARARPDDVAVALLATQAAVSAGRSEEATRLAWSAYRRAPHEVQTNIHLAMALLAAGDAGEALSAALRATAISPDAQDAWGWVDTAARAAGDPWHAVLSDYASVVQAFDVAAPAPWPDQASWLSDLARALDAVHDGEAEPYDQSLRNGTQTFGELSESTDPVIASFYAAIDAPIRRYMEALGAGSDPLRRRNTGRYRLNGSWSVRLRHQGRHANHFHPEGWLSSAFYVRLPEQAMQGDDRAGWIQFGQPPYPTSPMLAAEHAVRPRPGMLVLFPSYMWHGTAPFSGDETRLTIAFDVSPN